MKNRMKLTEKKLHNIIKQVIAEKFTDISSEEAKALHEYDPEFGTTEQGHFGNNGYEIDKVWPWQDFTPGKDARERLLKDLDRREEMGNITYGDRQFHLQGQDSATQWDSLKKYQERNGYVSPTDKKKQMDSDWKEHTPKHSPNYYLDTLGDRRTSYDFADNGQDDWDYFKDNDIEMDRNLNVYDNGYKGKNSKYAQGDDSDDRTRIARNIGTTMRQSKENYKKHPKLNESKLNCIIKDNIYKILNENKKD